MEINNLLDILDNYIADPAEQEFVLKRDITVKKIASLSYKKEDVNNPAIVEWLKDMTSIRTVPKIGTHIKKGDYIVNLIFWHGTQDYELAIFKIIHFSKIVRL